MSSFKLSINPELLYYLHCPRVTEDEFYQFILQSWYIPGRGGREVLTNITQKKNYSNRKKSRKMLTIQILQYV